MARTSFFFLLLLVASFFVGRLVPALHGGLRCGRLEIEPRTTEMKDEHFTSTPTLSHAAFPVRLAGGRWPSEGRVEVYYSPDRTWGTVCDNRWDELDANVVCRQLGLPPATQVVSDAGFGHGTGPILLDGLRCTGSESSLSECPSQTSAILALAS